MHGDNEGLHRQRSYAAIEALTNAGADIYRAWVDDVEYVPPTTHDIIETVPGEVIERRKVDV